MNQSSFYPVGTALQPWGEAERLRHFDAGQADRGCGGEGLVRDAPIDFPARRAGHHDVARELGGALQQQVGGIHGVALLRNCARA